MPKWTIEAETLEDALDYGIIGERIVECEDCQFSSTPEWDSDEVYCTKHNNWFRFNGYCHLGRRKDGTTD